MMAADRQNKDTVPFRGFFALIVVFACLACASVGVAVAFGSGSLSSTQLWALVAFLLIFPFFGVAVFGWLSVRHAKKLVVSDENKEINWTIISSEDQKTTLNKEVNQLAATMKVPREQMSDLRSAYIVAQDLAMRKIQQESKLPLMRFVNVGNATFDAAYVDKDLITCVQTTFVVTPTIRQEKINAILKKASSAKGSLNGSLSGSRMRLLLVLITQLDREGEAKLRSSLVSKFSSTPVDVDIRLLDFQGLQKVYSE